VQVIVIDMKEFDSLTHVTHGMKLMKCYWSVLCIVVVHCGVLKAVRVMT
jgi:hypothetical protein